MHVALQFVGPALRFALESFELAQHLAHLLRHLTRLLDALLNVLRAVQDLRLLIQQRADGSLEGFEPLALGAAALDLVERAGQQRQQRIEVRQQQFLLSIRVAELVGLQQFAQFLEPGLDAVAADVFERIAQPLRLCGLALRQQARQLQHAALEALNAVSDHALPLCQRRRAHLATGVRRRAR